MTVFGEAPVQWDQEKVLAAVAAPVPDRERGRKKVRSRHQVSAAALSTLPTV
jgi:hypothetical protein